MTFLAATAEQDVFSIYLNLDACDSSDDQATKDMNPEPLPPLEFSFLPAWHDAPITLPPLDLEGSREACWNTSPPLGCFSSMPINDSILLSPIGPSLECSSSINWLLADDDEEYIASDDTTPPLIRCRSASPCPPVSYPIAGSLAEFLGAQEFERLAPASSPSPSSSSLSTTDSECSSLFSPGTSALTSPASSILSLDDVRRSCSASPESVSCLSSPSMRLREAVKETGENHTAITITRDSRTSGLKGRRKQRRLNPISSRRRRQVSSGDPQDRDPSQSDQFPYSVVVDGAGKGRPKCACGKSFTRISDLKRHNLDSTSCPLAMENSSGKKPKVDPRFVCDMCGGAFSRYDSLDRHQRNRAACQRVQRLQKKNRRPRENDSDDDD